MSSQQLETVLDSTIEFLHRQGAGEALAAVVAVRQERDHYRQALEQIVHTTPMSSGEVAFRDHARRALRQPLDPSAPEHNAA